MKRDIILLLSFLLLAMLVDVESIMFPYSYLCNSGVLCGIVLLLAYGLDKQSVKETEENTKKGYANIAFALRGLAWGIFVWYVVRILFVF